MRVQWEEADEWVKVGDRLLPPRYRLVSRPGEGDPQPAWTISFELREGVPVCTEVVVSANPGGREVRSTDLRSIRLEDYLEGTFVNVAMRRWVDEEGVTHLQRDFGSWRDTVRQVRGARRDARRKVTDELLEEVAKVYRDNIDSSPTQAVSDRLGVAERTARLYVRRARDAGFLGEAPRGKAGEL